MKISAKPSKILVAIALLLCTGCATIPATSSETGAKDALITSRVSEAIFQDRFLRTAQIRVTTREGVVRLTGVVEKALDIETALQAARSVPGVIEVRTELDVKN